MSESRKRRVGLVIVSASFLEAVAKKHEFLIEDKDRYLRILQQSESNRKKAEHKLLYARRVIKELRTTIKDNEQHHNQQGQDHQG